MSGMPGKRGIAWTVLGTILVAGALSAPAAVVTNELAVTRDTFIDSNRPTTVLGGLTSMTAP